MKNTFRWRGMHCRKARTLQDCPPVHEVTIQKTKIASQEKQSYVRRFAPVIIDLRVYIYSIESINTLKQEMVCEFLLSANWYESNDMLLFVDNEVQWDKMWDPRIYFPNAVEMRSSLTKRVVFTDNIKNRSMIQWSYRVKGRFKCPFDITSFPFDDQVLSIYVSSYWNDSIVKLRQEMTIGNNISNALSTFADGGQWELQKYILSDSSSNSKNIKKPKAMTRKKLRNTVTEIREPVFQFHVHASRKYNYYLWNIASMVNMISILAFTSFSIDRIDIGKRLSVSLTLLLTVVAFKNFVSSILPKVSYLTLLDKYVLFNVAFIFLVSIENAIVGIVDEKKQPDFDLAFLFVSIAVYLLFQTFFIVLSIQTVKKSQSKFRERYIGEYSIYQTLRRASEILKLPVQNGVEELNELIIDQDVLPSASYSDEMPRKSFLSKDSSCTISKNSTSYEPFELTPSLCFRKSNGLLAHTSDSDSMEEEQFQLTGKSVS